MLEPDEKKPDEKKPDDVRVDLGAAQSQASAEAGLPDRPELTVDKIGNMLIVIPMHKTNEIFARGLIDMARTQLMRWYVANEQKQREIQILAQKTGFQRFKDRILSR